MSLNASETKTDRVATPHQETNQCRFLARVIEWSRLLNNSLWCTGTGARTFVFLTKRRRAPMSSDPPSGAPGRGDVDQRTWNKGVIVATILAAFAIGVIV